MKGGTDNLLLRLSVSAGRPRPVRRSAVRTLRIGPADHGRRMSLVRFAPAVGTEGRVYELERGVIVVVDVPGFPHDRIERFILDELTIYSRANPGRIEHVTGGTRSVLRAWSLETERNLY